MFALGFLKTAVSADLLYRAAKSRLKKLETSLKSGKLGHNDRISTIQRKIHPGAIVSKGNILLKHKGQYSGKTVYKDLKNVAARKLMSD